MEIHFTQNISPYVSMSGRGWQSFPSLGTHSTVIDRSESLGGGGKESNGAGSKLHFDVQIFGKNELCEIWVKGL